MKILCEAGLQVCAINSGPRTNLATDYRRHRQVYDLKYRGCGDPLRLKGKAHQEPFSVEESEYSEGRDLFEHDVAYSNAPGTDWYWKRCKATGGKANFWGRSSARFGDIDFKAADLDGFGENWAVDYAERCGMWIRRRGPTTATRCRRAGKRFYDSLKSIITGAARNPRVLIPT